MGHAMGRQEDFTSARKSQSLRHAFKLLLRASWFQGIHQAFFNKGFLKYYPRCNLKAAPLGWCPVAGGQVEKDINRKQ